MNHVGPAARDRTGLRGFLYTRLCRWLDRPHADRVILALGVLLLLPSLDTGLGADDYLFTLMLDRPCPIEGFQRAPLDIFRFCDPRFSPALVRQGIFSWWDDPETKLMFLRPLSALTHWFDYAFFRNTGWFMHLHSVLWAALLLMGVRVLYRDLIQDRLVANLALALYALDDARGWLVSWVAARNAAIATAISVWALVAYHRERSGRLRTGQSLGPALFGCALLAGEGSVAICAYLLGYALFLDTGSWRARLLRLWPYAAVLVVWRVVYRGLGYGQLGSSMYVDPLSEPLAYLKMLFENGPILLGAQLGGMWSDVWNLLFVAPRLRMAIHLITFSGVIWVALLGLRRARHSSLLRFGGSAALLAVLPASTVFPADRLLTWIALGASIVLAGLIAPVLRNQTAGLPDRKSLERTVFALLVLNLIGVVFLPSRARGNIAMRDFLDRADVGIPHEPEIANKTLVFVNPPLLPFAAYLPLERAARGVPRPRTQHVLAIGATAITLERRDLTTLSVRPDRGFLLDPVSKLMWSERRPFHAGERIAQGELTVLIKSVTADSRPLEVEMLFPRPLEDPSYVWRTWQDTHTGPFTPPPVGSRIVLPGAEYFQTILGVKLPIEARL